ncbi:SDR family oxidoreductase [Pedobacter sp. N36a]|uniref:SDR family oxidoreductase n=1 Tax=Pedobacter sp. N36a TaxID=2767996 RepID=UPI001656901B|nr:SDR family oxidoreductase [Pedobacter sp. N36a]MBC8988081.1 SDR family oxidoreductase [Pedobacter sp. N36a]
MSSRWKFWYRALVGQVNGYGLPEDISSAIAFLLADESSWLTGQVIGIDGGLVKLKMN